MTNTTNTSANTELEGKPKAALSIADLDMRDYFAAKAMQAFCANDWPVHADESVTRLASFAYMMADAMLATRAK